jgi:hypothetical protein
MMPHVPNIAIPEKTASNITAGSSRASRGTSAGRNLVFTNHIDNRVLNRLKRGLNKFAATAAVTTGMKKPRRKKEIGAEQQRNHRDDGNRAFLSVNLYPWLVLPSSQPLRHLGPPRGRFKAMPRAI